MLPCQPFVGSPQIPAPVGVSVRVPPKFETLAYSLKHSRTTLCMPAFYPTVKRCTSIKNAIIVLLIVHRPRYTVSKHAFRQTGQMMRRIFFEERGGGRGISFRTVMALGGSKLVELVFRCRNPGSRLAQMRTREPGHAPAQPNETQISLSP